MFLLWNRFHQGHGCSFRTKMAVSEVNKAHDTYSFGLSGDRSLAFLILQVSVLRGAPETVRELLGMLGLQKYTLGLSLHGWDDLDYFR